MCKTLAAQQGQQNTSNICPRTGKCCSNCRSTARIEQNSQGETIALVLQPREQNTSSKA